MNDDTFNFKTDDLTPAEQTKLADEIVRKSETESPGTEDALDFLDSILKVY